jgi:hypothetical protein
MKKTIKELESTACLYWPNHLAKAAADISSLPILLKTQDQFLSILKCSDKEPISWLKSIKSMSTLSANIFLKHLMVLSDIGGERLQRIAKDFSKIFPKYKFKYIWNSKEYAHEFSKDKKTWTNKSLNVEKSVLLEDKPINRDMVDAAMLLLWGSSIIDNDNIPQEICDKCVIGQLLGKTEELDQFVKQRYILVSRITGGSTVNDLGHACEQYVKSYLESHLPKQYSLGGHNIKGVSYNKKDLTTFDLIVTNNMSKKCCAIEISFQVTTNSVIERKAGLAKSRKELLNKKGHKVAYIIDGSGNFQRKNAISTIAQFSDCVVNFSDSGLQELVSFIKTS